MRIAFYVLGALCCLMGGVWFLQGINVLPGSFMTGQTKWAIYGGLLVLVGVCLIVAGATRGKVRHTRSADSRGPS